MGCPSSSVRVSLEVVKWVLIQFGLLYHFHLFLNFSPVFLVKDTIETTIVLVDEHLLITGVYLMYCLPRSLVQRIRIFLIFMSCDPEGHIHRFPLLKVILLFQLPRPWTRKGNVLLHSTPLYYLADIVHLFQLFPGDDR